MCVQADLPGFVVKHVKFNHQVGTRQRTGSLLRPLNQLQARAGKDVAQAGISCFARILKAVKVKMPGIEAGQLIRFHYGISRAFDATFDTQRAQQVAHQSGLAGAEITAQFNQGLAQHGLSRESRGKTLSRAFIAPVQSFYNRRVSQFIQHVNVNPSVSMIRDWARELGFSQIGVAGVDLSSSEAGLSAWLAAGFHGGMGYMAQHGLKRARPAELLPGTLSVITLRMDYLSAAAPGDWQEIELQRLSRREEGTVSIYARGRDYHKVLRHRLQLLAARMTDEWGPFGYRVFTDSAPVLEAELAARSGQGWRGKHTLLLNREAGSMFFLGEIYVDLQLSPTEPVAEHCGRCQACIDVCPTGAIVAPYRLDARRCISYLTIEHTGSIALELRPLLGNHIYGCDDCQLVCPWNKFAKRSALPDFDERAGLTGGQLVTLFGWTEDEFLRHTEGSPIRRIGHERWLRNVAVALGNALRAGPSEQLRDALLARAQHPSALVREHVLWALAA